MTVSTAPATSYAPSAAAGRPPQRYPGVELALFDGMGHSSPRPLWPEFATRIAGLVDRVERQP